MESLDSLALSETISKETEFKVRIVRLEARNAGLEARNAGLEARNAGLEAINADLESYQWCLSQKWWVRCIVFVNRLLGRDHRLDPRRR